MALIPRGVVVSQPCSEMPEIYVDCERTYFRRRGIPRVSDVSHLDAGVTLRLHVDRLNAEDRQLSRPEWRVESPLLLTRAKPPSCAR
jgi:hypothetical protein